MGELILLGDRKGVRPARPQFLYDLACPLSYLAAEQVEPSLGQVEWIPACGAGVESLNRAEVTRQAQARHLPLVWPERHPAALIRASRAAAAATADGHGARFGLAALRLAFCGGFDLEDPEILAEAAAAAGISVDDCLEAAEDPGWDPVVAHWVDALPAVRMGASVFGGSKAVVQAAAVLHARSA
jgi:2-hydroxychromene-2-carboxylate isomerase